MKKVYVMSDTTKNPYALAGECAGYCWGGNTSDEQKNIKRGEDCFSSEHWRTAEFPQVFLVIEGFSARVIRELYTHIGGAPTRLQASTRYIDYGNFDYIIPPSIEKDPVAKEEYEHAMDTIKTVFTNLQQREVPKEDIANLLPLGMETTIVLRTNARNLVDMSHQRLCKRAYWEFRELMQYIMKALSEYDPSWEKFVNEYFVPKCELTGVCKEKFSCGRKPKLQTF